MSHNCVDEYVTIHSALISLCTQSLASRGLQLSEGYMEGYEYAVYTIACSEAHAMPHSADAQAGSSDARGSGGTASETKQKYTLKSEGGGTYKVAGGEQINVSCSSALEFSMMLVMFPLPSRTCL